MGGWGRRPFEARLNKLGAEGWELVSMAEPGSDGLALCVFKRPKLTVNVSNSVLPRVSQAKG